VPPVTGGEQADDDAEAEEQWADLVLQCDPGYDPEDEPQPEVPGSEQADQDEPQRRPEGDIEGVHRQVAEQRHVDRGQRRRGARQQLREAAASQPTGHEAGEHHRDPGGERRQQAQDEVEGLLRAGGDQDLLRPDGHAVRPEAGCDRRAQRRPAGGVGIVQ
jgi:hypothetical protein